MKQALLAAVVLLITLAPSTARAARWEQSAAERFPGGEEPAPETVTALHQDRAGFLWVGSREGEVEGASSSSATPMGSP
jgi:ligand-binding sensor domain-containing protein